MAEKEGAIKEYLIVDCVDKAVVDQEDVMRFSKKAQAFRKLVPVIAWWDETPPITAVIAHTGQVTPEAEALARMAPVRIGFKRFGPVAATIEKNERGPMLEGCKTTRIYCRPGCRAGKRMKPENRVTFATAAEARVAGYRACKLCKPDGTGAG